MSKQVARLNSGLIASILNKGIIVGVKATWFLERYGGVTMNYLRQDARAALAVENGLTEAMLSNVKAGATIMKAAGVPLETALRVLLHPAQRRVVNWHR